MRRKDIEKLWIAGKRAEAIEAAKDAADEINDTAELLDIADVLQTLAEEAGRCHEADNGIKVAAFLRRKAWHKDNPQSVHANQGLVRWYVRTGRYQEAETELTQMRTKAERFVNQTPLPLLVLLNLSADVAVQAGRYEDAIAHLQRAIEIEQTYKSTDVNDLGSLYREIAQVLLRINRVDEAINALESSISEPCQVLSGSEEAEVLSDLAQLSERQGQVNRALNFIERAVKKCRSELGSTHPHTMRHCRSLARLRALKAQ
ncbi:MAG TPA: hypothetical protein DEO56_07535 [Nitrosomonas nitrosa]|nr:hypothetical protein [Nitrosomonas nitrosa]HNP52699.1 tetratricopeptide repeat protein [Nitrosomonas nitrosa]